MNSIKKNYVYQVVYQVFSFCATIILTPYLSRVLGADGIGINSYVTANVSYFVLFGNLGLFGYGQREIALHRDDKKEVSKLFWELETLHILCFAVVCVVYTGIVLLSGRYKLFYIINYFTIFASIVEINWFFQAYERFDIICRRNIVIKVITIFLVFLLVKSEKDLGIYILIISTSLLIGNLLLWINLKNYVAFISFRKLSIKRHIKETMVFFLPTIAGSVYSLLDKSVINWITHSDKENGYYEQAYKILLITNVIVQSFSTVMSPAMTYLFSLKKHSEMKLKLNKALYFMFVISIGCCFGMLSIVHSFVPVFFGNGYMPVINLLYVFMPLVIILGISVYLDGLYLVPVGKRKQSAYAVCVGALSNIFLNTILVFYLKALGASIATLLTEIIVSSIMIYLSRNVIMWKQQFIHVLKCCLCGIIMFCLIRGISCIIIFQNEILNIVIQILFGIIVYFLLLIFIKNKFILEIMDNIKSYLKNKL